MEPSASPLQQQLADAIRQNEELKRALEECSSARGQAARELEQTTEVANAAAEEMQHFIYAVGHDLRAPLRSVASYAQLLQRQYADNADTSELTGFIAAGAAEMNTLIEDLLKYSRSGGAPRRTTVNLGAIVQFALMNLQPQIQQTGAVVTVGELPEIAVDESQFMQLFQQIIGNALKFRGSKAPRVEITAEERTDDYVLSVRDNGQGIESKYHEAVFTPFKRLHGKDVAGTGLGLAICKKIVRANGGKLWVESDGHHGSNFKFTVPV